MGPKKSISVTFQFFSFRYFFSPIFQSRQLNMWPRGDIFLFRTFNPTVSLNRFDFDLIRVGVVVVVVVVGVGVGHSEIGQCRKKIWIHSDFAVSVVQHKWFVLGSVALHLSLVKPLSHSRMLLWKKKS